MPRRTLRRRAPLAVAAALVAVPAMPGSAVALTDTVPKPRQASGQERTPGLQAAVSAARKRIGASYAMGATGPGAYHCSGLTMAALSAAGIALPHSSFAQYGMGKAVDRGAIRAGDLVFFDTAGPGASHVGIVIGGDQFVHAPSERGVVRVESLNAQYWASRYIGAKRVS